MQQSEAINDYLKTVCDQIRWKKAHDMISEEMEHHILDQRNAYLETGLTESEATSKAILEMGDPVLVGSQLDHAHRPKTEWSLVIWTGIILMLGFIIRISIANDTGNSANIAKSLLSVVIGLGCMAVAYFIDFTIIGKYPKTVFLGLSAMMMIATLVSPMINGYYYYTRYILLLFPTAFVGIVYSFRKKSSLGLSISGAFLLIPMCLGLRDVSVSSVFILVVSCLALVTYGIQKGWFGIGKIKAMLLVYVPGAIAVIVGLFMSASLLAGYQIRRIEVFLHPETDPLGAGYMSTLIREVVQHAKFLGESEYIGTPLGGVLLSTDFVLTYLIQRFGWISLGILLFVLGTFIVRIYMLCAKQKSILGRWVSVSVLMTLCIQIVIYIICNLGYQLLFSPSLPLISYGGAATIANMSLIGIMLSAFKSGDLTYDKALMKTKAKAMNIPT